MKILSFFLAILTLSMILRVEANERNKSASQPDYSTVANQIIKIIVNKIERPGIRCVGSGMAMFKGPIRQATVSFQVRNPWSKEEFRKTLVDITPQILADIAKIPHLNDCLYAPPFTLDNLDIILFNTDPQGRDLYDPSIAVVSLCHGLILYETYDPKYNYPKVKNSFTETFEEARKIVNAQNDIRKDAN